MGMFTGDGFVVDLPHARGDEPQIVATTINAEAICPTHVGMNRGETSRARKFESICPTHVGMNRIWLFFRAA